MSNFKKLRPLNEVRLREWPAGRVNQMKVMLSHLEHVANIALAAQVSQTTSRKFNELIPKIVSQDIDAQIEFREVRLRWDAPFGLEALLFYELQLSTTPGFSNIDRTEQSPDPQYVFGGLLDAQNYYIRLRVVNTRGEVGPWSDTILAPTPNARIVSVRDADPINAAITSTSFANLYSYNLTNGINGTLFYMLDYEVTATNSGGATFYWTDVEFRWLMDGAQQGQTFTLTAFDRLADTDGTGTLGTVTFPGIQYMRCGSFIQRPHEVVGGDHIITLQGRLVNPHPTPGDLTFVPAASYGSPANIQFKNFSLFLVNTAALG